MKRMGGREEERKKKGKEVEGNERVRKGGELGGSNYRGKRRRNGGQEKKGFENQKGDRRVGGRERERKEAGRDVRTDGESKGGRWEELTSQRQGKIIRREDPFPCSHKV